MFGIAMAGCNLIVPPDPPPEPRQMGPDHFAWQALEITRDYDFIGVERIDCPKLTSTLTGYGLCIPVHLPMGAAVPRIPRKIPAVRMSADVGRYSRRLCTPGI